MPTLSLSSPTPTQILTIKVATTSLASVLKSHSMWKSSRLCQSLPIDPRLSSQMCLTSSVSSTLQSPRTPKSSKKRMPEARMKGKRMAKKPRSAARMTRVQRDGAQKKHLQKSIRVSGSSRARRSLNFAITMSTSVTIMRTSKTATILTKSKSLSKTLTFQLRIHRVITQGLKIWSTPASNQWLWRISRSSPCWLASEDAAPTRKRWTRTNQARRTARRKSLLVVNMLIASTMHEGCAKIATTRKVARSQPFAALIRRCILRICVKTATWNIMERKKGEKLRMQGSRPKLTNLEKWAPTEHQKNQTYMQSLRPKDSVLRRPTDEIVRGVKLNRPPQRWMWNLRYRRRQSTQMSWKWLSKESQPKVRCNARQVQKQPSLLQLLISL